MAALNGFPQKAPNNDMWDIFGSFKPNGASAISAATRLGLRWSVAHTTTGVYTITFTDSWAELDAVWCALQETVITVYGVKPGLYTAASKTLVIQAFDVTAPTVLADVPAVTNTRIHFGVKFRNSAVPPSYGG